MIFINKKGIELQFFWVFIMIAGAIILLFFFTLSQRYKAVSEEKISYSISSTLDTIITEISQSPDTVKEIPIPKANVGFFCSSECDCKIKIGKSAYSLGVDKLIFAQGLLKEKSLVLWSKPFKLPFRITNFLYISNKKVMYFVVADQNIQNSVFFNDLKKSIEDKIEVQIISDPKSAVEGGYLAYKFIFIGEEPGSIDDSFSRHKDVKAVYFEDHSRMDSVQFYKKKEDVSVFEKDISALERFHLPARNLPIILAAIFSDDHKMFSCNIKEAFRKMSFVTDVYVQRIKEMMNSFKGDLGKCTILNGAIPDLDILKHISLKLFESFDTPESLELVNSISQIIPSESLELDCDRKTGLLRKNCVFLENGCPAAY